MACFSRPLVLIPFFFAVIGLLPHLAFSAETGEFLWMETASDENSYLSFFASGDIETYRLFGATVLRTLVFLTGGSIDGAMMLMDAVLPAICAYFAVRIASALGFRNIFAPAAVLLIPLTLFSFSDINFWGGFIRDISPFADGDVAQSLKKFVPNLMMTFFPLYRTPEPQASLAVALGLILALLHYRKDKNRLALALLGAGLFLLPFIYISIALGFLVFFGGLALLDAALKKRFAFLALFAAAATWHILVLVLASKDSAGASLMFRARLPLATPSVFWGIAGCACILWKNRRAPRAAPDRDLFAFAAFAAPVVTLNQQILTGLMVQARNWEFYINYTFVALGVLLLVSSTGFRSPERLRRLYRFFPLVLAAAIAVAQCNTYLRFRERNLESLAAARLMERLRSQNGPEVGKVLLDNPAAEAGVANRLGFSAPEILPGHLSLMKGVTSEKPAEYLPETMPLRKIAYAIYRMRGMLPDDLQKKLEAAVASGACGPDIQYFFAVMDCSGVLSDYRALRPEALARSIPLLRAEYAEFIKSEENGSDLLFVTASALTTRPEKSRENAGLFRPVTVYAYNGAAPGEQEPLFVPKARR